MMALSIWLEWSLFITFKSKTDIKHTKTHLRYPWGKFGERIIFRSGVALSLVVPLHFAMAREKKEFIML